MLKLVLFKRINARKSLQSYFYLKSKYLTICLFLNILDIDSKSSINASTQKELANKKFSN